MCRDTLMLADPQGRGFIQVGERFHIDRVSATLTL